MQLLVDANGQLHRNLGEHLERRNALHPDLIAPSHSFVQLLADTDLTWTIWTRQFLTNRLVQIVQVKSESRTNVVESILSRLSGRSFCKLRGAAGIFLQS